MKKKLLPLAGGVAVLVLLLGVYTYKTGSNRGTEQETEPTAEQVSDISYINSGKYTLCDKAAEDLRNIQINSAENQLTIEYSSGGYVVRDYENVDINLSNTASVASTFIGLYSDNKIEESDREKYGLASPLATGSASFSDGSSVTLTLGSLTADKKYYYMESSDAEGIYLVDAVVGGRLLYGINDLVNKSISAIKPDYVNYIEVINADGEELLMYYNKEKSDANTTFANSGLVTFTMEKPLEGATVYPFNLTGSILSTCSGLTLNGVVEAQPDDYVKYGLDTPNMTVRLRDDQGSLELKVGNAADDNNVYVMADDRISVFTMDKSLLKPFENYTITDFVEKFVALHMRSDVNSVELESEFGGFTLDFKVEGDNRIITDENGSVKDNRIVLINGNNTESDNFSDFYELLAGLTFDQISGHTEKSGEPAAVLTYTLLDGTVQTTEFYIYNDNFYSIGKDGEYDMLVSKQSIKQIIDKAAALSK